MGKDSERRELALIARPIRSRTQSGRLSPLENPSSDVEKDDPLLKPRSDEPGVGEDGACRPIENPG